MIVLDGVEARVAGSAAGDRILLMYPKSSFPPDTSSMNECYYAVEKALESEGVRIQKVRAVSTSALIVGYALEVPGDGYGVLKKHTRSENPLYGVSDNAVFAKVGDLQQLTGVYQNKSEHPAGSDPLYLSGLIWGDLSSEFDHRDVRTVRIRKLDEKTLLVTAMGDNGAVKESEFVEGRDFKIESGRINLFRKAGFVGFKPGDLAFGPYYETHELGIDRRGDGKFSRGGVFAGLLCVFPFALDAREEFRFRKEEGADQSAPVL